jgi:REP element-mobilizing transposase RayT
MPRPIHERRATRLPDYDYSRTGAYYVTICTKGRECLFGDIKGDKMVPNLFGIAVWACWGVLPDHYPHVELDAFVVMPNHLHAVITLTNATMPGKTRHGLSEIVRNLKSYSARMINEIRGTPGAPVWQRSFYDHIVRDERDLRRIRQYIADNPAKWAEDHDNPLVIQKMKLLQRR